MRRGWYTEGAEGKVRRLTVVLAGECCVRKSAVFRTLTGMRRHTYSRLRRRSGVVEGDVAHEGGVVRLLDLPCNSDPAVAVWRYHAFGDADAVAVVFDAAHPGRDLRLLLRILEVTDRVAVCVVWPRDRAKKGIRIDLKKLSDRVSAPVAGAITKRRRTLTPLLYQLQAVAQRPRAYKAFTVYDPLIEAAVSRVENALREGAQGLPFSRFAALRLLEGNAPFLSAAQTRLGANFPDGASNKAIAEARERLLRAGIDTDRLQDMTACANARFIEDVMSDILT